MMEQSEAEQEAERRQETSRPSFDCEYIGTLALAKDFTSQVLYHVRRNHWQDRHFRQTASIEGAGTAQR